MNATKLTPLFIYGTLRRTGRAHHLMQGAEFSGDASISGRMVHVDEYPGLVLCDDERVVGELYWVNDAHLRQLDQYEGCNENPPHYIRTEVEVVPESGDTEETQFAQVYVFQLLEQDQERIEGGDWIKWLKG